MDVPRRRHIGGGAAGASSRRQAAYPHEKPPRNLRTQRRISCRGEASKAGVHMDRQQPGRPAHPGDCVYPLVATGARFANWWAADVTEQNGAVALGFFNRRTVYRFASARPGTFAPRRMAVQNRCGTDYFVSCNTTWGALLLRLNAAAEETLTHPPHDAASSGSSSPQGPPAGPPRTLPVRPS